MSSWNMNVWVSVVLNRTVNDSENVYRTGCQNVSPSQQ